MEVRFGLDMEHAPDSIIIAPPPFLCCLHILAVDCARTNEFQVHFNSSPSLAEGHDKIAPMMMSTIPKAHRTILMEWSRRQVWGGPL